MDLSVAKRSQLRRAINYHVAIDALACSRLAKLTLRKWEVPIGIGRLFSVIC